MLRHDYRHSYDHDDFHNYRHCYDSQNHRHCYNSTRILPAQLIPLYFQQHNIPEIYPVAQYVRQHDIYPAARYTGNIYILPIGMILRTLMKHGTKLQIGNLYIIGHYLKKMSFRHEVS